MKILSYSNLFDSEWSDSQLLKYSYISFISVFIGVFGFFSIASYFYAVNIIAYLIIIPNSMIGIGIFSITLVQMFGWFTILQTIHRGKFGYFFKIKGKSYPWSKIVFIGLITGFLLIITPHTIDFIFKLLGYTPSVEDKTGAIILSFPIMSILFLTFIGMTEEIFFRGILQRGICSLNVFQKEKGVRIIGVITAIIISSIIFTAMHGAQYNLFVLAQVMIMSTILGFVYYKFESLSINMFAHGMNNFFGVLLITLPIIISPNVNIIQNNIKTNYFAQGLAKMDSNSDPLTIKYNPDFAFARNCSIKLEDITNIRNVAMEYAENNNNTSNYKEKFIQYNTIKKDKLRIEFGKKCNLPGVKKDLTRLEKELSEIITDNGKDKSKIDGLKHSISNDLSFLN